MINLRSGIAGFVGASKTLINGVLRTVHAVFTEPVVDTPDCFLVLRSLIDDTPASTVGVIDATPAADNGLIGEFTALTSLVNPVTLALNSLIVPTLALQSGIEPVTLALNSRICEQ